MKERFIKVLKIAPFLPPKVTVLENNITALQHAVSIGADYRGLIEVIDLDEKACIICNEERRWVYPYLNESFFEIKTFSTLMELCPKAKLFGI